MASAPAGASSARLCSTGSRAPVRGAGGSCGNLSADSRYQKDPPSASARRGGRIADFHPAGWAVAAHDNVILLSLSSHHACIAARSAARRSTSYRHAARRCCGRRRTFTSNSLARARWQPKSGSRSRYLFVLTRERSGRGRRRPHNTGTGTAAICAGAAQITALSRVAGSGAVRSFAEHSTLSLGTCAPAQLGRWSWHALR